MDSTSRLLPRVLVTGAVWLGVVGAASAIDVIYTKDGNVFSGEVARVEAQDIVLKIPQGEIPVHRSDVDHYDIVQPPSYGVAVAALNAQRYADAVTGLRQILTRYAGLDLPWVQDAVLQLGDAYIGLKDFTSAKQMMEYFKRLYQTSPKAAGTDARMARILVEQKSYGPATEILQKMLQPVLGKQGVSDPEELAAAEGLVLLGDCQVATGKPEEALDSYLTVITLFNVDPKFSAEACYKAGQIFEQLKKPQRARDTYAQVVKDWPSAAEAADAQKRLAALPPAPAK